MRAKRSIAFIILGILLVSTFSCCPQGPALPPGMTLEDIQNNAAAADAEMDTCQFDMDMTMDISMTVEEEIYEGTMTSATRGAIDRENGRMSMAMDISVEMAEEPPQQIEMEMYIVDDYVYMKMEENGELGQWLKSPMPEGYWEQQDIAYQQVEWLSGAEVEFRDYGTVDGTECYVLEVRPDLEKLWQWMPLTVATGGLPDEVITDRYIEEWVAQDNYFTLKSILDMTMGFDFFGIEITYDIAAIITMHHIPVTIELPPGAEEAEEVPELPF